MNAVILALLSGVAAHPFTHAPASCEVVVNGSQHVMASGAMLTYPHSGVVFCYNGTVYVAAVQDGTPPGITLAP